jgi:hypothetical protein
MKRARGRPGGGGLPPYVFYTPARRDPARRGASAPPGAAPPDNARRARRDEASRARALAPARGARGG